MGAKEENDAHGNILPPIEQVSGIDLLFLQSDNAVAGFSIYSVHVLWNFCFEIRK